MAYGFGTGVQAGLGATDYSNYLRGALSGAQMEAQGTAAIGQGIQSALGSIGQGITSYAENKKKLKAQEGSIKSVSTLFSSALNVEQGKPNPQADVVTFLQDALNKLNDPSASTDERYAYSQNAVTGLSNIIQLGAASAKEQEAQNSARYGNLLSRFNGKIPRMIDTRGFTQKQMAEGTNQYLNQRLLEQKGQPQPVKLPTSYQEYELAQKEGYGGTFEQWKQLGRPTTNINMPANVGKMQEIAFGKLFDTRTSEIDPLISTRPYIDAMEVLINNTDEQGQVITGALANLELGAKSLLNDTGLSNFEDVAATQEYMAQSVNLVGQIIKQFGSGTGLSDADREFATKAAAGIITMDRSALKRLIGIAKKVNDFKINAYNDRVNRSFAGEEGAWARESLLIPKGLTAPFSSSSSNEDTNDLGGGFKLRN